MSDPTPAAPRPLAADEAPRLHPALELGDAADGLRVVCHTQRRKYFRIGEREAGFLCALDGSVRIEALRQANPSGFDAAQVDRLLAWFDAQGFLADRPGAAAAEAAPRGWPQRLKDFAFGPQRWRIPLVNPDEFLNRHVGLIHRLFTPAALAAYLVILLLPVALPLPAGALLTLSSQQLGAGQWLALYAATLLAIVLHEGAHAITCKHFGGRVHRIGIMLLYLQPVAYCDVSDSWRLRERDHKIAVSAAGCFANLLLGALAWSGFALLGAPVLLYFAVINLVLALWNLIPFVRLDGYWIAVHLLNEPHLREKSFRALMQGLAGGPPAAAPSSRPEPVAPGVLLAFGWLSVLFGILFWTLGLLGTYRLAAWFSPTLAGVVAVALAALLLYRGQRWLRAQWAAVRPPAPEVGTAAGSTEVAP